jgi:hypothetical protein
LSRNKPFTLREIRGKLPRVGDKRMEKPTVDATPGHASPKKPQECVVVYVHPANLWYTVRFKNGVRECYKLPAVEYHFNGGFAR